MSEKTPHKNQGHWWRKWKRQKSRKHKRHRDCGQFRDNHNSDQASHHHDNIETQDCRTEQDCDGHRTLRAVKSGSACTSENASCKTGKVGNGNKTHSHSAVTDHQRIHVGGDKRSSLAAYRTACACTSHQRKTGSAMNAGSCGMETGQNASTSGTSASTNNAAVKEIPGFYYDPDKKRYFRLLAGHNNFNPLTRENLDKKNAEKKRLEMLKDNLPNCKPQNKQNFSLCPLQRRLQNGQLTSRQFTRYAQEQAVSNFNLTPRKLDNFPDRYFDQESGDISFLQVDCNPRNILMVLSDDCLSRMWQGTITCDRSKPRMMTLSNWRVLNIISNRNTKITSASWVSTENSEDLQVIYSLSGGPMNLIQLMKCPTEEDDHIHIAYSYESNHESAWTCAWSPNPLIPGYLSIGSNKKALVVDTISAEKRKVFTNHSDVLAQVFATKNPVLYNGTRRGEILGCDLRSVTETRSDINLRLRQKVAVCSVRLLKDENYLVASDMSGQVKLWDLRQCLCVQEYKEHHNRHSYLPICLDSTENILYGVGQDRYTRLWSLKEGRLLRTIPCPTPPSPINPAVVYSQQWHNGAPGGLLLGVQRDLYWYPL